MVSVADGRASSYALGELQSRGTFFVTPGADVYAGMVVGEHTREEDLDVSGSSCVVVAAARVAGEGWAMGESWSARG